MDDRLEKTLGRNELAEHFEAFFENAQTFLGFSDPDLDENQKEFLDHLENLQQAITSGQLNGVEYEVRDLRNCMQKCHREFR